MGIFDFFRKKKIEIVAGEVPADYLPPALPMMPTVNFDPSKVTDLVKVEIRKNVELIEGLAPEDFDEIYEMVLLSVQKGRDLGGLRLELQARFGMTKQRAMDISRFQHNNASALIDRIRQQELGIKEAIWRYSGAPCAPKDPTPKEARQDAAHKAADGKTYDVSKGMYLNGKWTWPSCEERCKCTSRSVLPPLAREIAAGTRTAD